MNDGGNPSVGGGGFAASPAGTAPLYYKSAEIASGSAQNLCKKSGDVGGVCPARHWFALPLWKTQWGACPGVAGSAGVSDTRRGACLLCRLPTLPLWCPRGACRFRSPVNPAFSLLFRPYPPSPLPGGKGVDYRLFLQGASPLASLGLNPGGTGYPRPGGEDHLKRRRRLRRIVPSPPVPPLLGCRHCS